MKTHPTETTYFHTICPYDAPCFCHFLSGESKPHYHADYYEFCIITGSYRHVFEKSSSLVHTGTLLFIKPGETHALLENSPNSHHYSLIVKDSYFKEYCSKYFTDVEALFSEPELTRDLPGVQFSYFSYIGDSIFSSHHPDNAPLTEHLLSSLIFACLHSIMPIRPSYLTPNYSTKVYAKDLFQRLNSFQFLSRDVSEWYDYYPVSQTALINDFKKLTGYTIVQYRNMKRMDFAANLLLNSNYSVTAIANMLNISSLGYFSQQFKEHFGMTPTEYQALHRSRKSDDEK